MRSVLPQSQESLVMKTMEGQAFPIKTRRSLVTKLCDFSATSDACDHLETRLYLQPQIQHQIFIKNLIAHKLAEFY